MISLSLNQSLKFKRGLPERGILGFAAEPYMHKREDGLAGFGCSFCEGWGWAVRDFIFLVVASMR